MDAKEKAEDLILTFAILDEGHNHHVKKCALLAINEIKKALINLSWMEFEDGTSVDFWEEVEKEVNSYKN